MIRHSSPPSRAEAGEPSPIGDVAPSVGDGRVEGLGQAIDLARVSHLCVRVVHIAETDAGDRAATAVIVSRRNTPEPAYDAAHGVCEPCPTCGTTVCNSGIYGACRITPEQHPNQRGDVPLADTPREDFDSRVEPIGRAQDETHWSETYCRQPIDLTIF